MKNIIFFLFCFFHVYVIGQVVFEQGMINGGVTAAGFSAGTGNGSGMFDIYIEPGSTIKKAYAFTYRVGFPPPAIFSLNQFTFEFDTNNVIMNVGHASPYAQPIYLIYKDVTEILNPDNLSYSIILPYPDVNTINWGYWSFFLYVLYENPSLPTTNYSILINDKELIGNEFYIVNNLNPIDTDYPVSFSLYTDRSGAVASGVPTPNSLIFFNEYLLGVSGGSDNVNDSWSYAGVKGHFYYQNNQLYGLDDDVPDANMDGTDGLADVSSYLINNETSFNFNLRHINYPNQPDNATNCNLAYFLTYTSPCQPFDVTVPNDTTVCYGSQVQLNATGGSSTGSLPAYEWSPATGLSCTTCPNPIFTADSSMFYTVRIRNNDSCSVVRPVKINVKPIPSINAISTVATECGSSTGAIKVNSSSSIYLPFAMQDLFVVTENGDTLSATSQNNLYATVSNLGVGNYTVFYTDTNGCESLDSVVTISSINNTIADFTVTPTSGGAPLTVNVNNGSQNATDFEWFTSTGLSHQGTVPPAYVFDSSGTYQIMLVAWKNDPACADTAYASVWVYDSLIVHIPNVFTANGDGVNDYFSITVNQPVKAKLQIVNRWGNEVFSFDGMLNVGATNLWNGTSAGKVTDGVYFYTLTVDLMTNDLIPPPVSPSEGGIENHSLKKEGFVTVIGD